MAYDRNDRDSRSRWSDDDRFENRGRGRRDERGFFERAGDEVASWFGDDDAERRRRQDQREGESQHHRASEDRGWGREESRDQRWERDHGRPEDRGLFSRHRPSEQDRFSSQRSPWSGSERDYRDRDFAERERGYRPMTGDYGRGEGAAGMMGAATGAMGRDYGRSESEWSRDPYRSTSRAGSANQSDRSREDDPHYRSWRDRHISELDRDYDDYRRENQSRFENDFTSWRDRRQTKRGLLGQIREHMEVVGSDDEHVGTVDKIAGDRVILTKSDPESGGAHHSLSCSNVERVEGERVVLDCSADEARKNWRDESRSRALFERDDQGEMGPGILDRSFSGTYR